MRKSSTRGSGRLGRGEDSLTLPSFAGGRTTSTVGFFEASALEVAEWLKDSFAGVWALAQPGWASLDEVVRNLKPTPWPDERHAFVPLGEWCALLNNRITGTDLGLMPPGAARDLGCRAIRAVRIEAGEYLYPARMLEVYGPDGDEYHHVRTIYCLNDGGRWAFETAGEPFAFEHLEDYGLRLKRDRLTGTRLIEYLAALGVPVDQEPRWRDAWLAQRKS